MRKPLNSIFETISLKNDLNENKMKYTDKIYGDLVYENYNITK